ncbi:MAG: hypothetical protein LBT13_11660 [Treponema sp.]|jgi:hypothetical protein|nr:hypothetical protein [Treponema sp.]
MLYSPPWVLRETPWLKRPGTATAAAAYQALVFYQSVRSLDIPKGKAV